ncbi:MAG: polyphosphate polymerase domain-containing protein [Anaerolineaceae bacterium]|nr:MAG: polyphosphate polymerase domain-containing protein [Anaerolineaceae bacterium]
MTKAPNRLSDFRYERKFFVSELTYHEIESIVKLHPAVFSEIYHPRYVNNLYFDSFAMKSYFDNVDGVAERIKARIRWYGDMFGTIEKPVLEFKIKRGSVGRKESFPLKSFSIDENLQLECIVAVFESSDIPEGLRINLGAMEASLLNRYRRKYFLSGDKKYRITIDSELAFCPIANARLLHKYVDFVSTVLEVKYDPAENQHANKVTSHFPFRMTRSSKYVNGIDLAYL